MVNRIFVSTKFIHNVKKLKKSNKSIIDKLESILLKLINMESVQQYHPHPMNRNKDVTELHIDGNILLLYKYEDDLLEISLVMYNISNHDELDRNIDTVKNSSLKEIPVKKDMTIDDMIQDSLTEDTEDEINPIQIFRDTNLSSLSEEEFNKS